MAATLPVLGGSITFTSPSYNYGQTSQAINGGYNFDLPLATVASFTNNAMAFSAANSQQAQGFLSGVIGQQQAALTNVNNQSFGFQDKSLQALSNMYSQNIDLQRFKIKKEYSTKNLLKPGSGCFITTAVCKAANLPDDCGKLQYLRAFRDDHLLTTEEGKSLVATYYAIAPQIVALIDALPTSASIYNYLSCNFIDLCVSQISTGQIEAAIGTYRAMVEKACELAGFDFIETAVCTCKAGKRAPNFHAKTCPVRGGE